jgi:hypothetical protein
MQPPPIGASHILGRLSAFGLAICVCAATTFAVDFETAKKEAGRLNETKEGATYMDKCQDVLHKYISSGMDACGAKYPDTKEPALIALMVAADGHVIQKMSSPGIAFGECVMSHFPSDLSLPRPPHDAWPVVVGVENRHHEVAAGGGTSSKEILTAYDDAIAPYVAKGRETWPGAKKRFLAGNRPLGWQNPHGGSEPGFWLLVRVRLRQANKVEEIFVNVTSIKNGTITGNINSIDILTNYKAGQSITIPESEIKDWVIKYPNGSQEGNVVGKFLNEQKR